MHHNNFFNKTNRGNNCPNLFCQETLPVSGTSSAHHQEFSTVHSAHVYVMQVWWQLSSTTILVVLESCHQTCMTYTCAECTVENSWWWAEEVPETGRVSWQNKFGKLVRLKHFQPFRAQHLFTNRMIQHFKTQRELTAFLVEISVLWYFT